LLIIYYWDVIERLHQSQDLAHLL